MRRNRKRHVAFLIFLMVIFVFCRKMPVNASDSAPEEMEIPIDEENFPDEVFRQIIVSKFDSDNNGFLNQAEIDSAKWLDCSEKGIGDLSGIEIFTNLQDLNCSQNELTFLNLSGCKELKYLNCSDNGIMSLSLNDYPQLYQVNCENNQLRELVVKNCTSLDNLWCNNNELSELDLSNSGDEYFFLDCSYNKFSELDLTQCRKIFYLRIVNNKTPITYLYVTPEINYLSCGGSDISCLDISDNDYLIDLYRLGGCYVQTYEGDPLLAGIIPWHLQEFGPFVYYGDYLDPPALLISPGTDINAEKPAFSGSQMILSSEIGVQFRIQIPEDYDVTGSYMSFVLSDGRKSTAQIDEATNLGNNYYLFSCYINVLELADTITATYHFGNNRTIEKTYSAVEYVNQVKESYADNTSLMELVDSLVDYGYYMQQSGWSDGKQHTPIVQAKSLGMRDVMNAANAVSVYRFLKDLENSGIGDVKFSLVLNSKTMISVFLKPEEGETITTPGGTVLNVGGETYYQFNSAKIGPINLGKTYDFIVSTERGTATVHVSAMSYVDTILNTGNYSDEQMLAMTAFYYYYKAARDYS